MKVYLAGPLFTAAEREFNARLAELLCQAKIEVWLPQEFEQRTEIAARIFSKDVEGIGWADVVVANMDGPDPDSGTCWECGYAYKKKPVIVFRTDFRNGEQPNTGPYNLMLTESATKRILLPFANVEEVAAAIIEALKAL
jgi:nucleoside 2-deoxyribosyltransferase